MGRDLLLLGIERLAADLLMVKLGGDRFTWGSGRLVDGDELRARYIAAVRAGDGNDFGPLLEFARS